MRRSFRSPRLNHRGVVVFLAVAGERQHLDTHVHPGHRPVAWCNCPPFSYTSTAYHRPPSRTAWTCFTQPSSGRDSASVSVPMLGTVICRWSCHFTRLPSPTWLLNDTALRLPRRWNHGNPQEPDWCHSGLPFLHWLQRCNAVARRIRPLVQHLPIDGRPPFGLFATQRLGRGRQPRATTRRRVMLAWLRSVVPAGRCKPTGSRRRAGTRPVRWNCQGWRCGFAFCGRVALGHIMADYEKIQLAANPPNLAVFQKL